MGRIIALDIGTVRVGVAASDPTGMFAQAVAVLSADSAWMEELAAIISDYGARSILVGIPLRTDGSEGPEAGRMRKIVETLACRFPDLEMLTWDERFTTVIANQALLEADVSRAGRKGSVDKIAAAVLLQSYLDSKRPAGIPEPAQLPSLPGREGRAKGKRRQKRG
jgi:putative Holliday junction resolvase